ncbi:transient receptor potential channel pyrexia-like [Ctenocephalides felis]|uniref:transient receptor potential channel pyrexia-like n=1 Tax=Ctenocephalides felis TaxID=7515 RepID=UPI000E6E26A5|nr:transient receptor potential channel pyrexia-like [Ctenocephalides felis]
MDDSENLDDNLDSDNEEDEPDSISDEDSGGVHQFPSERPRQEIWPTEEIRETLQSLPYYEEISMLLQAGKTDLISRHQAAWTTGLLLAAWTGNHALVKQLLEDGANVHTTDPEGRTPLHLACCIGDERSAEYLLDRGARLEQWDKGRRATALHCAASAASRPCVMLLLNRGADVNAGLQQARSPLHYAVLSGAVPCVRELLRQGACPDTPQVFTETPLHVAAALGSEDCIRLLLEHGADFRSHWGPRKMTALHLASEDGNAICARLLTQAGASVDARNHRKQTSLHLAALAQSPETLEVLLECGGDPNATDADGRTPLHGAIVKESRSCECARLLLDNGALVNRADNFGYTPLHIAALNEFSSCVYMLIGYGADVTARTDGGVTALSFILRRTPDVVPRYLSKFDHAIKLNDHEIGDADCELKLDFRILVPSTDRGETELLRAFIEVGRKDVLKHPLCETFLFLKWRRIRKFFLLSLLFHAVFVIHFSWYIIAVFLIDCTTKSDEQICQMTPRYAKPLGFWVLTLNCMLLAKELFQISQGWIGYSRQWENWLQWIIIITVFLCVTPQYYILGKWTWQHHVAALAILFTWLELMMLVGRFPIFGLYVQMFTTVAVNFSKFLMAYCFLIVAFALSFGVLFAEVPSFSTIPLALLKAVVMMSGELEFDDIFHAEEYPVRYPITAHIIFCAFIVLVTVILTNLLVGLAVSDIQGLQQSAGLDRLSRQAELVGRLESILFSKLLRRLPTRIVLICHRSAMLLTSTGQWALYIRPNDPREMRIPRELITSIYQLIVERKDLQQNKRKRATISKPPENCIGFKKHSHTNISKPDSYSSLVTQTIKSVPQVYNTNKVSNHQRGYRMRTYSEIPSKDHNGRELALINENIREMKLHLTDLCQRIDNLNQTIAENANNIRTDRNGKVYAN